MMDQVYEQLYVGDIETLRRQDVVRSEGVDAVVRLDLRDRDKLHWDERFTVLDVPINDGASVPDGVFEKVTDFIYEQVQQEHTILVHCNMGISPQYNDGDGLSRQIRRHEPGRSVRNCARRPRGSASTWRTAGLTD